MRSTIHTVRTLTAAAALALLAQTGFATPDSGSMSLSLNVPARVAFGVDGDGEPCLRANVEAGTLAATASDGRALAECAEAAGSEDAAPATVAAAATEDGIIWIIAT